MTGRAGCVEVHQWIDYEDGTHDAWSAIVTRYEYDVRGNRTAQIDARERRTEFEYDLLDRLRVKRYRW